MSSEVMDDATREMATALRHGHQWAIAKGILVSIAILAIGAFTMAMPAMRPASGSAMDIALDAKP